MIHKTENEKLVMKMVGYESRIAELNNYVHALQQKNYEEACQIKLLEEDVPCSAESYRMSQQKNKRPAMITTTNKDNSKKAQKATYSRVRTILPSKIKSIQTTPSKYGQMLSDRIMPQS